MSRKADHMHSLSRAMITTRSFSPSLEGEPQAASGISRPRLILRAILFLLTFLIIPAHDAVSADDKSKASKSFTFMAHPKGAKINITKPVNKYIGVSDSPVLFDFSQYQAKKKIKIIPNASDGKGRREPVIIDCSLLAANKLELMFTAMGYENTPSTVEIDYIRMHDIYPDKPLLFFPLNSKKVDILFTTRPSGAMVELVQYSPPLLPGDHGEPLGKSGEIIKGIDLSSLLPQDSSAKNTRYEFYFRLNRYEKEVRSFDPVQISYLAPDKKNPVQPFYDIDHKPLAYIVYRSKDLPKDIRPLIKLKPTMFLISDLLHYTTKYPFHALTITAVTIPSFYFLIIPAWKKHAKRMKHIALWEELSRIVDTTDPNYGKIFGNHKILQKIGAGGMATVYKAMPTNPLSDDEAVAVKIMKLDDIGDDEYVARFKREMKITSRLSHPNIIRILDFGDMEGVRYIVMDLIKGKPLKESIPDEGVSPAEFMRLFKPVLEAVGYAHEKSIIHRDLKPDNIMVTDEGKVIVMDFGLARQEKGGTVTMSGTTLGTPAYMSPEQASGEKHITHKTDQYSLGVVAFQMLTGQLPFYDENTIHLVLKHITEAPPPLRSIKREIPENVEQIILKMLEKDPEKRYSDLKEVLDQLERAINE